MYTNKLNNVTLTALREKYWIVRGCLELVEWNGGNGTLEWNTGMNNSRLRMYMIIFFVTCAFMLFTWGC